MRKFTTLNFSERKNLIHKTSNDLGLRFDIVEKDIWVCYILERLFSNQKLKNNLIFKGGTCLSKAYNAIGRFSEDIDITINSNILQIDGSSQKTNKIRSRNRKAAKKLVENEILPILKKSFDNDLKNTSYDLFFDEKDQKNTTLFFLFPQSDVTSRNSYYGYIKPRIKLEFGSLGGTWPSEVKLIKPYAKEILPNYFNEFEVNVLSIKRNFIEKLLILHAITMLPVNNLVKQNYSRHYYDVYSIIQKGLSINSINDLNILKSVVDNESKFWTKTWVDYNKIQNFSDIKLIPSEARIAEIKQDYKNMEEMFFTNFPKFDDIISKLQNFEDALKVDV